jgi:hypothetical protein
VVPTRLQSVSKPRMRYNASEYYNVLLNAWPTWSEPLTLGGAESLTQCLVARGVRACLTAPRGGVDAGFKLLASNFFSSMWLPSFSADVAEAGEGKGPRVGRYYGGWTGNGPLNFRTTVCRVSGRSNPWKIR